MQLTLLGTGLANPNPRRRGPSQVVRAGEHNVLVDCGAGAVHRLVEAGLGPTEIDHVLITHHHWDHYVDLDHLIVARWTFGGDAPLNVYGPTGQKEMIEHMLKVHETDLTRRIEHMGAHRGMPEIIVHEVDEGPFAEIDGMNISAFQVEHPPVDPAFGFRFDSKDRSIVISGDTKPCENLVKHAHGVDILVHECMMLKPGIAASPAWGTAEDRRKKMATYHTFPEDLGLVARDAAPKLLVTSHMTPAGEPWELQEIITRDYSGPTVIGEDLLTF